MTDYNKINKNGIIRMLKVQEEINHNLVSQIEKMHESHVSFERRRSNLRDRLTDAEKTIVRMANDETMRRDYEELND